MGYILSNLYYNAVGSPAFKDVTGSHQNINRSSINRSRYRIYDLKMWFESDFEFGGELIVERISENAKYDFHKHKKLFW